MLEMTIRIEDAREDWITTYVEDADGTILGQAIAPVVEGATFDVRAATIREAVEMAISAL